MLRLGVLATAILLFTTTACAPTPIASSAPSATVTPVSIPPSAMPSATLATPGPTASPSSSPPALKLPPVNAGLDYQLGGAYDPPRDVRIVSRDRTAKPAPGLFNICYVNGFQVQQSEREWWATNHPDLLLHDASGKIVIDEDWNEVILDVLTGGKRAAIGTIVGDWIHGCAADGFDAIEIDNLDTYSRSRGLLTEDDAVAQVRLFADVAHSLGLPIAQKNSAEIVGRRAEMGTDFAIAEECDRYDECDVYTGAYGDHVLVIEYRRKDFKTGCATYPGLSIVLRDLDLVAPTEKGYVYDGC